MNRKICSVIISALLVVTMLVPARIYAPYYRQVSINVYALEEGPDKELAKKNAFMDVSAAFKYYLEHKNNGRPLIAEKRTNAFLKKRADDAK